MSKKLSSDMRVVLLVNALDALMRSKTPQQIQDSKKEILERLALFSGTGGPTSGVARLSNLLLINPTSRTATLGDLEFAFDKLGRLAAEINDKVAFWERLPEGHKASAPIQDETEVFSTVQGDGRAPVTLRGPAGEPLLIKLYFLLHYGTWSATITVRSCHEDDVLAKNLMILEGELEILRDELKQTIIGSRFTGDLNRLQNHYKYFAAIQHDILALHKTIQDMKNIDGEMTHPDLVKYGLQILDTVTDASFGIVRDPNISKPKEVLVLDTMLALVAALEILDIPVMYEAMADTFDHAHDRKVWMIWSQVVETPAERTKP